MPGCYTMFGNYVGLINFGVIIFFKLTALIAYTDHELLKLLSDDDRDAFDKIYARHWEDMFKTAFSLLRDTDASKDVVQDIFIWLWEHRHSLAIISLKSYLKTAIKFKVANYIRSGTFRESFFKELAAIDWAGVGISPDEELEIKQLTSIIQEAISTLPEKCREIFRLSRDAQLTNQQIAAKLNISVKTVESQMTIAIRRVRVGISQVTKNDKTHFTIGENTQKKFVTLHPHRRVNIVSTPVCIHFNAACIG